MKLKIFLFVALIITSLGTGCKKDNSGPPVVTLSPSDLYAYGKAGSYYRVTVKVSSDIGLERFYIKSTPDNQPTQTIVDNAVSKKNYTYDLEYLIPAALAGQSAVFQFTAQDEEGQESSVLQRLWVAKDTAKYLVETSGHIMYSNLSINPDAYDLEINQAKFSTLAGDSIKDIQDNSDTSDVLKKEWISPAGGKFVKFNGFDYANATDKSAKDAFDAGAQLDKVTSLQANDIIITRLGSQLQGTNIYIVIKITNISDSSGKDNDFYVFNIKKAP